MPPAPPRQASANSAAVPRLLANHQVSLLHNSTQPNPTQHSTAHVRTCDLPHPVRTAVTATTGLLAGNMPSRPPSSSRLAPAALTRAASGVMLA